METQLQQTIEAHANLLRRVYLCVMPAYAQAREPPAGRPLDARSAQGRCVQILRHFPWGIQLALRLLSWAVPGTIALLPDVGPQALAVQFRKFVADCGCAEIVASGRADLIFQLADRTYVIASYRMRNCMGTSALGPPIHLGTAHVPDSALARQPLRARLLETPPETPMHWQQP